MIFYKTAEQCANQAWSIPGLPGDSNPGPSRWTPPRANDRVVVKKRVKSIEEYLISDGVYTRCVHPPHGCPHCFTETYMVATQACAATLWLTALAANLPLCVDTKHFPIAAAAWERGDTSFAFCFHPEISCPDPGDEKRLTAVRLRLNLFVPELGFHLPAASCSAAGSCGSSPSAGFCLCGCSWTVDAHRQTFHLFVPFSLNQRKWRTDLNSSWQYRQIYSLPDADASAWLPIFLFFSFFFFIPK